MAKPSTKEFDTKILPNNIEAEKALLGCIFLEEKLIVSSYERLKPEDFFDSRNQEIYRKMKMMHDEGVKLDITTLVSTLDNFKKLEEAGGIDYIGTLPDYAYSTSNVDSYIDLIKDASIKRRVIEAGEEIKNQGFDPSKNSNQYLDYVNKILFEVSGERKTPDFNKITEITQQVKDKIYRNKDKGSGVTGLRSGFNSLDVQTLGFQSETLNILAARPAMGKSAMAMNIAVNAARVNKGAVVAIFSLEMSQESLIERLISSEASLNLKSIITGNISNDNFRLVEAAVNNLNKLNLFFDDSGGVTVNDIRAKCRKLKNDKERLDLVVIDYLQLINADSSSSNANRQEQVAQISRALKQMARELKVPVLALAQLSRQVENRPDKKPLMSDLRDSGSIEQDADLVMFLYRDDYYNKEKSTRPGEADLIIGKNRNGLAGIELPFIFEGKYTRFREKEE